MSRMFVCGDIHGAYDKLMAKLGDIGFDFENDKLYALGDLVDRGPDSYKVLKLLDEPWFESIKGNHELMVEERWLNPYNHNSYEMHVANGGGWYNALDATEKDHCYALVKDLPIAMVITTPTGRKIGLVHAEIPGNDWEEFEGMLSGPLHQQEAAGATALWGRTKVKQVQRNWDIHSIRGVDMVYMGHTPLNRPLQHGNMRWIDTGACWDDGSLTIEELV